MTSSFIERSSPSFSPSIDTKDDCIFMMSACISGQSPQALTNDNNQRQAAYVMNM